MRSCSPHRSRDRAAALRGSDRGTVVLRRGSPAVVGRSRNPTVNSKDPGFFGWHFHAPFDTSEVKTVAVFFKSNVFRRDLEKQLTEAVIKEIHLRTPYRVVGNHARSRLAADRHDHLRRQEPGGRGPDQPAARAERDDQCPDELDS